MKVSICILLALCIAATVGSSAATRPFKQNGSQDLAGGAQLVTTLARNLLQFNSGRDNNNGGTQCTGTGNNCQYQPTNYQPGSNNYQPGSNNYQPGSSSNVCHDNAGCVSQQGGGTANQNNGRH